MTNDLSTSELSLSHELQLDTLCVAFEAQCKSGQRPAIEEFLNKADLEIRPLLLKELLLIEWEVLHRSGVGGRIEEYRQRFSDDREIVDDAFRELPGETISAEVNAAPTDYQIISQLSADSECLCYRAVRGDDETEVDIVVLSRLAEADSTQLKKRIRLASQLSHPFVARVLESRLEGAESLVVLERMADRSLAEVIPSSLSEAWQERLGYGCQLASAVTAGHRLGLAHGGLTPNAIRIRPDDSLQIDFVRPHLSDETVSGPEVETLFLAPEASAKSEPDTLADVFSLSSLIVWLFTNKSGAPVSHIAGFRERLLKGLPQSEQTPSLVNDLCGVIERAINSDPFDRSSSLEILRQLERVAQVSGVPWPREFYVAETISDLSNPSQKSPTVKIEASDQTQLISREGLQEGQWVGRFRILKKLGAGGMGEVYEAEDSSDGSRVAVKILSERIRHQPDAVRRFYKEGRMLGEINSPFVTKIIEINEEDDILYIALEFVSGTDLRELIRDRAPLDEQFALSVISDVARGLVGAHELGIIHRDIKPANIMLATQSPSDATEVDDTQPLSESLNQFRVKLTDFGLARQLDQTETMRMTRTDMLLGTPTYMSPEQFVSSSNVGQTTDVYALGVTLFEMLAGQPPFVAKELAQLMGMHGRDNVPPVRKFNPDVCEATCAIIERSLAKKPEDRYADASQFLQEIERVLRGEPTEIDVHPHLPPHDPDKVFTEVFEWELKGSAAELWPYVSNTDRINRAVGVPSVVYKTRRDERGRLRKYGDFKMAGLRIGWEEHPFEWVVGQRLGILREFHQGPFEWFLSIVELLPQSGGGTKLRHTVRIQPRGLMGRLVAMLEVTVKGKRGLDRVYRRIDQTVTGQLDNASMVDAFTEPEKVAKKRLRRLEQRLDRLASRGIAPRIVEQLGEYLRDAPAQELGRIRPIALARNLGLDGDQFVEGCFHAAKEGLLDVHWDILCPTCRISAKVADTLREIEQHERCDVCDLDFEVDLANSLELIFRANPEIRTADTGTYCIGGPEHSPHVVVQIRMAAGERVELTPVLAEGYYVLRSAQIPRSHQLRAVPMKGTSRSEIVLSPNSDSDINQQMRAGRNLLAVTNDFDREIVVRLERKISLQDVLTAARASTLPTFRDLFPEESLKTGQILNVAMVTLLAVEFADVGRMFHESGDAAAYSLVERFRDLVSQTARHQGGVVVNSTSTRFLCAFENPEDVLLSMLSLADALEHENPRNIRVIAGAHRGTVLATSKEGSLGYFGTTVHLVESLPRFAQPGELLLTEALASDPLVLSLIQERELVREICDLQLSAGQGQRCQRLSLNSQPS